MSAACSSRAVPLALLLLWGSGGLARATPAPSLARLLEGFRRAGTLRAHFHEEKQLAMLAVPLRSEGTLAFAAPDRLARRVVSPTPSAMVIEGNHLLFSEGHGVQSLSLSDNALARMLVDSFVKILAGDEEGLRGLYDVKLTPGSGAAWALELTPRDAALRRILERIDLAGRGAVVDRLRIRETSGDETVTTFSAVELGRPFTPEELRRTFDLDAR